MSNDWKERWLKKFLPAPKEKDAPKLIVPSTLVDSKKVIVDKPTFNLKWVETLLCTVNETKEN
jgi:hypothetical protein